MVTNPKADRVAFKGNPDARPEFKDHTFKNDTVVKDIFNSLNAVSFEISKVIGLSAYKWQKKTQRYVKFNTEIREAAEKKIFKKGESKMNYENEEVIIERSEIKIFSSEFF